MSQKNDIKCICYFLALKEGKLLLTKRNKNPREGYYSFTGGHARKNELLLDALKREVLEEIKCSVVNLNPKIIRVTGNDNTKISDDFFLNAIGINNYINGYLIEQLPFNPLESSFIKDPQTVYNLFIGEIVGEPQISNEVSEVKWEYPDIWIEKIKSHEIKIQPVDFLLLSLYIKYKNSYE